MNVGEAVADASRRLAQAGTDAPRLSARLLLAKAMDVPAGEYAFGAAPVTSDAQTRLDAYIARRIGREPMAYILGHKEFWGIDFLVGPGVLIPRPETETLIEELLREVPDRSRSMDILDLGTGSGCLIVAALVMFQNAKGTGIDSSADALGWARRNVALHGLQSRCEPRLLDWRDEIDVRSDVILANPPYIGHGAMAALPADIARYEPATSLLGGQDGLDAFRNLAPRIAKTLKRDGVALLEIGHGQDEAVQAMLLAAGLEVRRIVADLAGIPRCVVAGFPK